MGLDWKVGGQDPVEYFAAAPLGSAASAAPKAAPAKGKGKGGPAPPPAGSKPPPAQAPAAAAPAGAGGGGMSAIFDAINKGSTGGLKKVTDDMKCKNISKDVPAAVAKKTVAQPAAKAAGGGRFAKGPKGDPIKALQEEQNTWILQNIEGDNNCTLDSVEKHQCVRITDCANSTVRIDNRVKSISVDNCLKVNIIMKDVISVVELVNSDRCKIQVTGKVNMLAVDKCDGVSLYLNKESLECEIVTSKSSEMNLTIPDPQDETDTIEIPIPEQFVTKIKPGGKTCQTTVSSLYTD